MGLVSLLTSIAFIPSLFPIFKIIKRKDINAFDLLLLFYGINFCLIPFVSTDPILRDLDHEVIWTIFYLYTGVSISFLIIDVIWSYSSLKSKFFLTNISFSLRELIPKFENTLYIWVLSVVVILLSVVVIIPNTATFFAPEQLEYSQSSFIMFFQRVFSCFYILNILLFCGYRKNVLNIITLSLFIMISFFLGRRYFLGYILFFLLAYYSMYLKTIKTKKIINTSIILGLVFLFLFPFFNILRMSKSEYAPDKETIIQSFSRLFSHSIEHYDELIDDATESTRNRSLGLYMSIYDYISAEPNPLSGEATVVAISTSIPSIINPNKKIGGSQKILEEESGTYKDMSDSFLLLSYADWDIFGIILSPLYIICYLVLLELVNFIFYGFFRSKIIWVVYIGILFLFCYNIEQTLEGALSILIQSPLTVLTLIILFLPQSIKNISHGY